MNKNLLNIIITLILVLNTTTIFGTESKLPSNFEKVNFDISENWSTLKQKRKNIISYKHEENIATLNIRQEIMSKPVTANALKEKRAKFTYDSWINVYERKGPEKENILSNVKESYVAIFLSQSLDKSLNITEIISGEYYYITENEYYIITIQTMVCICH